MEELRKTFTKGSLNIVWQPHKCQHSGNCVRNLPGVFKPKERPWIKMEGGTEDEIRNAVLKCPSGALSLE